MSPPFTPQEALRPQPDWPRIHAELRRPGVTLLLLWEEYRTEQPEGYGYSRFCDLYADWRGGGSLTMRQNHVAGDKLFVDFAGHTLAVIDPATGEVRPAQVFVAVLGASSLTYAELRWSQGVSPNAASEIGQFDSHPIRFDPPFGTHLPAQITFGPPKVGLALSVSSDQMEGTGENLPTRFANAVGRLERNLLEAPDRLKEMQNRRAQLKARMAHPFAYAEELTRAVARQKVIAELLMPKASEGLATTTEEGTFVPETTMGAGGAEVKRNAFQPIEIEGSNVRKADVTAYESGRVRGWECEASQAAREVLKSMEEGKEHRAVGVIEGILRQTR